MYWYLYLADIAQWIKDWLILLGFCALFVFSIPLGYGSSSTFAKVCAFTGGLLFIVLSIAAALFPSPEFFYDLARH